MWIRSDAGAHAAAVLVAVAAGMLIAGCRPEPRANAGAEPAVAGAIGTGATAESMDLSRVGYVQSATCIRCHPEHQASWRATFHRTMTQRATPDAVVGDFSNATYTYAGVRSRFFREGDRYLMETLGRDGAMHRYDVVMTVGSRRFQQYVAAIGDQFWRLPLAWNIEESRWFHLNAGFLHPDGSDFNNHTALWNANCIFCHNTKANPGADWERHTFSSSVAELGIACEACHGPGEVHVRDNSNPLRRYLFYASARRDPTIYSPHELPKDRKLMMCGHCHGQRTPEPPDRIHEFMATGDPYTAGDDLNRFTSPIWQHSELEGVDLSQRFWKDGTPRLTAYEYQGLLMSPDYQKGELTCMSCHTMHEGDPRGMITASKRGPAACVECHEREVADIPAHTKHRADSPGSDCYACHMPRMVYGLVGVHRSHRMQNPDPSRAWRHDMPEACTLCHTDRSASWAAREMARLYEKEVPGDVPTGGAYAAIAENIRALLGGDVIQRAVAVEALAAEHTYDPDPRKRLWAVPFLLITMEDSYPAIRHMSYRALGRLIAAAGDALPAVASSAKAMPRFDELADEPVRRAAVASWWQWWRALDKSALAFPREDVPLDADWMPTRTTVDPILASQVNHAISIGE